jgi:hypothetical protein
MMHNNVELLSVVAQSLEELVSECYFVGGAVNSLYATRSISEMARSTIDVDFVIDIKGYRKYAGFSEKLREKGFNEMVDSKILCRWNIKGIIVDVMPTDEKILGFSNRWYKVGIAKSVKERLPNGIEINIFTAPYYLASKLEALKGRGIDYRYSKDFEDIIFLFRSRPEIIEEVQSSSSDLISYMNKELTALISNKSLNEYIYCQFSNSTEGEMYVPLIIEMFRRLTF